MTPPEPTPPRKRAAVKIADVLWYLTRASYRDTTLTFGSVTVASVSEKQVKFVPEADPSGRAVFGSSRGYHPKIERAYADDPNALVARGDNRHFYRSKAEALAARAHAAGEGVARAESSLARAREGLAELLALAAELRLAEGTAEAVARTLAGES